MEKNYKGDKYLGKEFGSMTKSHSNPDLGKEKDKTR
jgi:hypothetical protein